MARHPGGNGTGRSEPTGGTARPASKARRSLVLGGAALAGNAALAGRLWQLQVVDTATYREQSVRNRLRTEPVRPVRGLIYDRNREALVRNVPVFGVWLTPADIPPERTGAVLANLAALTGERSEDLRLACCRRGDCPCARRQLPLDDLG